MVTNHGSSLALVDCGVIRTTPATPQSLRLKQISDALAEVVGRHSPTHVVVEKVFISTNPMTSLKLGEARGAAISASQCGGAGVTEISARQLKRAITGKGNASKAHVSTMVRSILGLGDGFKAPTDAYDALACALCYHLSKGVADHLPDADQAPRGRRGSRRRGRRR